MIELHMDFTDYSLARVRLFNPNLISQIYLEDGVTVVVTGENHYKVLESIDQILELIRLVHCMGADLIQKVRKE